MLSRWQTCQGDACTRGKASPADTGFSLLNHLVVDGHRRTKGAELTLTPSRDCCSVAERQFVSGPEVRRLELDPHHMALHVDRLADVVLELKYRLEHHPLEYPLFLEKVLQERYRVRACDSLDVNERIPCRLVGGPPVDSPVLLAPLVLQFEVLDENADGSWFAAFDEGAESVSPLVANWAKQVFAQEFRRLDSLQLPQTPDRLVVDREVPSVTPAFMERSLLPEGGIQFRVRRENLEYLCLSELSAAPGFPLPAQLRVMSLGLARERPRAYPIARRDH